MLIHTIHLLIIPLFVGAIFCDHMANFLGGFASKVPYNSVFHAEVLAIILTMEVILKWLLWHLESRK